MIRSFKNKVLSFFSKTKNYAGALIDDYIVKTADASQYSLVIIDDIYPLTASAFRIAEFNHYLSCFPDSVVYTTGTAFPIVKEYRSLDEVVNFYKLKHPEYKDRVIKLSHIDGFNHIKKIKGQMVYSVFLNNIYRFLPIIEKNAIPFAFTLYPGGGFHMYNEKSDNYLRRVLSSAFFRKVIVTQKITLDYLVNNNFCSADQIELVYGVVMPIDALQKDVKNKLIYKKTKETFDVCFVANKYMALGVDKGYDTFISAVKKISAKYSDVNFHVVGTFDKNDIDVSSCGNISFYGLQPTSFFPEFYSKMDIIVSPNVPFKLSAGAFDGFPTGSCIEAGIMGVALFCSDAINQNMYFKHKEDIVLIENDADNILYHFEYYYHNYNELLKLSMNGQNKIKELYSMEWQMRPRVEIIQEVIKNSH